MCLLFAQTNPTRLRSKRSSSMGARRSAARIVMGIASGPEPVQNRRRRRPGKKRGRPKAAPVPLGMSGSEFHFRAGVEETADRAERIAALGAGTGRDEERVSREGRQLVERIVDAEIETLAAAHRQIDPEVVIGGVRIPDDRQRVGVRRRPALERMLRLVGGRDDLPAEPTS